jgi:hypothetical protein
MTAADDPVIPEWELLVRRVVVNKNSVQITSTGELQFTTAGFAVDDDGISLYRAQLLQLLRLAPSDVVGTRNNGVPVGLMAGHVRKAGAGIVPNPIPIPREFVDPAHALVKFDPALSHMERKQVLRHALEGAFLLSRTVVVRGDPAQAIVTEVPAEEQRRGVRRRLSALWSFIRHSRLV